VRQPAAPKKVAKLNRMEKLSRGRPDFTAFPPRRGEDLSLYGSSGSFRDLPLAAPGRPFRKGGTERRYGAGGEDGTFVAACNRWSAAMPQPNDLSRSLVALDQNSTIIAVVELSQSSWLVAGMLPGIERQPRKKLEPSGTDRHRQSRQAGFPERAGSRHSRSASFTSS
jgi:hypothetical protein